MKPKITIKSLKGRDVEVPLNRNETKSKRRLKSLNTRGKSNNPFVSEKIKITNEDSNLNTEYFTSRKASLEASKESIDNRENQDLLDKKLKFNLHGTTAVSFAGEPVVGPETRIAFSTAVNFGPSHNRSSINTNARHSRGLSEGSNNINVQVSNKTSFLTDFPKRKSEKGKNISHLLPCSLYFFNYQNSSPVKTKHKGQSGPSEVLQK
jgi:hypothetical protein